MVGARPTNSVTPSRSRARTGNTPATPSPTHQFDADRGAGRHHRLATGGDRERPQRILGDIELGAALFQAKGPPVGAIADIHPCSGVERDLRTVGQHYYPALAHSGLV